MTSGAFPLVVSLACSAMLAQAPSQSASTQPTTLPAERCMYVPPNLVERVVYYHSFQNGADRPEVNLLGARTQAPPTTPEDGIAGKACHFGDAAAGKGGIRLTGVLLPLHRPLTLSMWWKLRGPMKPETAFNLVALHGKGFISNFARGQGPWCALKEPTFVMQVYNWPGVSNYNGIWHGSAWLDANQWHHVAMVISKGADVAVYWDGKRRCDYAIVGRAFAPQDVVTSIEFGPEWLIDELMILEKAMSAEEISDYITAVRWLGTMGVPVTR